MSEPDTAPPGTTPPSTGSPPTQLMNRRNFLKAGVAALAAGTLFSGDQRSLNPDDIVRIGTADVFPDGGWFGERLQIEVTIENRDIKSIRDWANAPVNDFNATIRFTLTAPDGETVTGEYAPYHDCFNQQERVAMLTFMKRMVGMEKRPDPDSIPPAPPQFAQKLANIIADRIRWGRDRQFSGEDTFTYALTRPNVFERVRYNQAADELYTHLYNRFRGQASSPRPLTPEELAAREQPGTMYEMDRAMRPERPEPEAERAQRQQAIDRAIEEERPRSFLEMLKLRDRLERKK